MRHQGCPHGAGSPDAVDHHHRRPVSRDEGVRPPAYGRGFDEARLRNDTKAVEHPSLSLDEIKPLLSCHLHNLRRLPTRSL